MPRGILNQLRVRRVRAVQRPLLGARVEVGVAGDQPLRLELLARGERVELQLQAVAALDRPAADRAPALVVDDLREARPDIDPVDVALQPKLRLYAWQRDVDPPLETGDPRGAERLVVLRLAADQALEVVGGVLPAKSPERGAPEVVLVGCAQPELPAELAHAPYRLVLGRGDERTVVLDQRAQHRLHDLVDDGPADRRIGLRAFVLDLVELQPVAAEELERAGPVRLDAGRAPAHLRPDQPLRRAARQERPRGGRRPRRSAAAARSAPPSAPPAARLPAPSGGGARRPASAS